MMKGRKIFNFYYHSNSLTLYLISSCVICVLLATFNIGFSVSISNSIVDVIVDHTGVPPENQIIQDLFKNLVTVTIVSWVAISFFIILLGAIILMSVVGPAFSIARHIKENMLKENFNAEIRLREKDFLSEIGDLLNQVSRKLRDKSENT